MIESTWPHITGMERPLSAIRNLGIALALITETIEEPAASSMNEIIQRMMEPLGQLDEAYTFLFRAHHPSREHFEREGWPADKAGEEAECG